MKAWGWGIKLNLTYLVISLHCRKKYKKIVAFDTTLDNQTKSNIKVITDDCKGLCCRGCLAQIAGSLPAVAVSLSDTCIIPLYPGAMAIV